MHSNIVHLYFRQKYGNSRDQIRLKITHLNYIIYDDNGTLTLTFVKPENLFLHLAMNNQIFYLVAMYHLAYVIRGLYNGSSMSYLFTKFSIRYCNIK